MADQLKRIEKNLTRFAEDVVVGLAVEIAGDSRTNAEDVGKEYGSPVLTGLLSASVRANVGSVDGGIAQDPKTRSGRKFQIPLRPLRTIVSGLKAFKLGQKIYVSDSVPYMKKIEFKRWSKLKTPNGVFKPTLAHLKRRWDKQTAALAQIARIAGR